MAKRTTHRFCMLCGAILLLGSGADALAAGEAGTDCELPALTLSLSMRAGRGTLDRFGAAPVSAPSPSLSTLAFPGLSSMNFLMVPSPLNAALAAWESMVLSPKEDEGLSIFLGSCLDWNLHMPPAWPGVRQKRNLAEEEIPLPLAGGVSLLFCNPYFLSVIDRRDGETGVNTDRTDDISFGLSSSFGKGVTVSAYSTVNFASIRWGEAYLNEDGLGRHACHRFAVAMRIPLGVEALLGACAGATVTAETYHAQPEFYVECRLKF